MRLSMFFIISSLLITFLAEAENKKDPFDIVKSQLVTTLKVYPEQLVKLDDLVSKYRATKESVDSDKIKKLISSLSEKLDSCQHMRDDLAKTIEVVQKNRSKFPAITQEILDDRVEFVSSVQSSIGNIRTTLNRASREISHTYKHHDFQDIQDSEEDSKLPSGDQQFQQVIRQQDEVLDDMSKILDNLMGISQQIGTTLDEQNHMLTALEDDIDDANSSLGIARKKLAKILENKKSPWCIVGGLSTVATVLLLLVIYS